MKAFLASTLLKKLVGADADLFFNDPVSLVSLVLVSRIRNSLLRRHGLPVLLFPQTTGGTNWGYR